MRKFVRASLKTGAGTIATLLLGAVAMKTLALQLGPAGVGFFSLLRHTQQTGTVFSTLGGQTALIQGLASREGETKSQYLHAALLLVIAGTVVVATAVLLLAPWLAVLLLDSHDPNATVLVRWLALPIVLGGVVTFFSGILNGFRAIGRLAWVNVAVAGTIAVLAGPAARAYNAGQPLALVALLTAGFMAGIVAAGTMVARGGWLRLSGIAIATKVDDAAKRHFLLVGGTTVVTGLAQTGTVLAVRATIVHQHGLGTAGIFDVAWTLSMMYVMLALTSFGTYYLPTLSGIVDPGDRQQLILTTLRLSGLLMVPLITCVIVLRPLVISVLYSSEFVPAVRIMRWMLIGDYLKVASWVLALPMVAYAHMKRFFWSEILANAGFLCFTICCLLVGADIEWIGVGFLVVYACYLAYTVYYISSEFFFLPPRQLILELAGGFVLILGASWFSWNQVQVDSAWGPVWIAGGILFSWLVSRKQYALRGLEHSPEV